MALEIQNQSQRAQLRRVADFHPTVWGDYFISHDIPYNHEQVNGWREAAQVLKEEVRMLIVSDDNSQNKLNTIDAVQRLGIAYHFQVEIEEALSKIYNSHQASSSDIDDLYALSLQFRLLRQAGYYVPSDILNKFKNNEGNFKEELTKDVEGILSLYEASHLSVHGETILDEALSFTKTYLETIVTHLSHDSTLANKVSHALKRPVYRALARQEAKFYIPIYEKEKDHLEVLVKFAKLDFNLVQILHQEELRGITKWWKDLDFATKLPFARDRVVECYFWPLGVYFEPQFAFGRIMLSKFIAVYSVIDDVYDVHGTIDELELFTEVINRFDTDKLSDQLPDYMKTCYQALLGLLNEIEEETTREGRPYCIYYIKEIAKRLANAYLIEAKWFHQDYIPKVDEYIKNGLVTSVYPLLTCVAFSCGMGQFATKEAFDWLLNDPKALNASSAICRLMDDVVSHKFEQGRGHVASAVECYMKQHGVTNEEEAYDALYKLVENAWKDLNEEILIPTTNVASMPLLICCLNFARIIDIVYKDEDGYTHSEIFLKEILTDLLLQPLAIEP